MRLSLLAASALFLSDAAAAQQPGVASPEAAQAAAANSAAGDEDVRVNQLIIFGDDPCPQGNYDEIIVCARLDEGERYRVPPALRGNPNDPANQAWANRAIELSYAGRAGIGSCSPAGPGGMIGCQQQLINQARAERANSDEVNWNRLIEEARQERLRRIDEAARDENNPDD